MTIGKRFVRPLDMAKYRLTAARRKAGGLWKTVAATAAAAAFVFGNAGRFIREGAAQMRSRAFQPAKKSGEVFEVKKSTFVALLVALAAVAGVLGALYFYVLRREKELDEYEQLLFSEDFNDDMLSDNLDEDAG